MKKLFIVIIMMFTLGATKANPIVPPPVISEFYIVNDSTWYVELVFQQYYYCYPNLDGFQIISSSGSSLIKNGISITADSILVLTQEDLQSPLNFNRSGDFIFINDGYWNIDEIRFGNFEGAQISSPEYGQSLVNYGFHCLEYGSEPKTEYYLVKDSDPTIGILPYETSNAMGTFTGFVYDETHHPIPGLYLGNSDYFNVPSSVCGNIFSTTITNPDGSYMVPEFSHWCRVEFFFQPSDVLCDTVINIEPDTINYFEFNLDTLMTNVLQNSFQTDITLSCFPNPTTGETTISFGIPSDGHVAKALLKIYNSDNEMIRILPVNIDNSQNQYAVKWDGSGGQSIVPSGMYYCTLELDGRKVATHKIIVAK
jgi:hypothetical protein